MNAANKLVVRRTIAATREELFDAWLDAKSLQEWMRPGSVQSTRARVDPRVGGRYEIVMIGENAEFAHNGEYRIIDRPAKLAFTWISRGTNDQPTLVTVEFLDRGRKTEVVLTHEGLPNEKSVADHTAGWSDILEKLDAKRPNAARTGR